MIKNIKLGNDNLRLNTVFITDDLWLLANVSVNCSEYSKGIFVYNIPKNQEKVYLFSDFDNFYTHLKSEKREKLIAKINKIKQKGKEPDVSIKNWILKPKDHNRGIVFCGISYFVENFNINNKEDIKLKTNGFGFENALIPVSKYSVQNSIYVQIDSSLNRKFDYSTKIPFHSTFNIVNKFDFDTNAQISMVEDEKITFLGAIAAEKTEIKNIDFEGNSNLIYSNLINKFWYKNTVIVYGDKKIVLDKGTSHQDVFFVSKYLIK